MMYYKINLAESKRNDVINHILVDNKKPNYIYGKSALYIFYL